METVRSTMLGWNRSIGNALQTTSCLILSLSEIISSKTAECTMSARRISIYRHANQACRFRLSIRIFPCSRDAVPVRATQAATAASNAENACRLSSHKNTVPDYEQSRTVFFVADSEKIYFGKFIFISGCCCRRGFCLLFGRLALRCCRALLRFLGFGSCADRRRCFALLYRRILS